MVRRLAAMMLLTAVALAAPPNIVTFLIDDMDLERVPFFPRLDAGAQWQLHTHLRGGGCRSGANCTYSAPNIEAIGARGARVARASPRRRVHTTNACGTYTYTI